MKGIIGILIGLCAITSCNKEPVQTTKYGNTPTNIQLILTAKGATRSNPYDQHVMGGVKVQVFKNSYDRRVHQFMVKYGTTDSMGKVKFEYLDSQDYYVEATYPNTDTAQITINYPTGAVTSYEDLLMIGD